MNRPSAKRKLNIDPPEFVSYSDYMLLHKHVLALTDMVTQLRGGLIDSGSAKLGELISITCPVAPDLPAPGPPLLNETVHDPDATPVPAAKPFFNFNTALSTVSTSSANPSSAPIDPAAIAQQAALLLEKSTRAVVERFPDDKSSKQDEKDSLFFTNFCRKYSLPIPTKIFRHQCSAPLRPLKMQFTSKSDRDSFLKGFNKVKSSDPDITAIQPKLRARRDLTRPELDTLYASRKFVYTENLKVKETKYIMSDITYKLNSKPKPFT